MDKKCWESSPFTESPMKVKNNKLSAEAFIGRTLINILSDGDGLNWTKNDVTNHIKYQYIINVKRSKTKSELCLNYISKSSDSLLQLKKLKIRFESSSVNKMWSKTISKQIKKSLRRITALIFIIDKIPGRCKVDGMALFQDIMIPVLQELKISYVIREINSSKDIEDLDQILDIIKSSDGVIILGGDETASSIISNIINTYQTDDCCVKHVPVPFCIIPTGYHNDISRSIWRSESVQNIFLNIFLYVTFQTDVLSVTKPGTNDKLWGFNCHYGFYTVLEKYRMANIDMKENLLMKKALKKTKSFDCTIQYTSSTTSTGHPIDGTECKKNCSSCNVMTMSVTNTPIYKLNSSIQSTSSDSARYETIKNIDGMSWMIINCIPCRNDIAENGFAPSCHFNDGSADMILVNSSNTSDLKKYLKYQKVEGTQLKLPFVDSIRIEDIHVNIKDNSSWSNCEVKSDVVVPKSKDRKSNIIVIEDTSSSSEPEDARVFEDEETKKVQKSPEIVANERKISKLFRPVMQVCKDLKRSTQASQDIEFYKKPSILESDKERERKAEKMRKKISEIQKLESSWMLDYNCIGVKNSSINIKVHSGVVSFFGDAMN